MVTIEPATTVCAPAAPNAQEGAGSRDAAGKCAAAGLACAEGNGRVRVVPFPAAHQLPCVQQASSRAGMLRPDRLSRHVLAERAVLLAYQIPGEGANAADLPSFSEAEDFILEGNGQAPDALRLGCLRQLTRARLGRIARLEQACTCTSSLSLDI